MAKIGERCMAKLRQTGFEKQKKVAIAKQDIFVWQE